MKKIVCMLLIGSLVLTLFLGIFSSIVIAQITEIVSDPEDDVIIISEDVFGGDTGEDFVLEKTADKPNIDITKLTYIREEGSTQVTLKLEVNSRGFIEDRNDFENVDPDDFNFTGSIVTYGISLETSDNTYEIEYMAGNCTLNYGDINATVIDTVLSVTFNLDDIGETFVSLIGTTMQFDINSLTNITYYMDIAPDSALFIAYPSANPTNAKTGESINFTGEYDDSFGISFAPYTYTWFFDDGTTSNEQNPTHSYQYPGTYYVRLQVEDSQGLSSEGTIQVTITANIEKNEIIISDESPVNGSIDIEIPVTELKVTVTDPAGNPLNVLIRWKNPLNNWETLTSFYGINENSDNIEETDCIEINYTGRYASNNTVFDSSYIDYENKLGGIPLQIFVSFDPTQNPPAEYSTYSPNIIKGLMDGIIGLEKGKSYTIGPIPPEEAYGRRFGLNDTVNTTAFNQNIFDIDLSLDQTLKVIERTTEFIKMKWVDLPEDAFTMTSLIIYASLDFEDDDPNYEDIILLCPLYSLWENATEIISVSDEKAMIRTTPNKLTGIVENIEQIPLDLYGIDYIFVFPNETEAAYTDDSISITSSPVEGKMYNYTGQNPYGGIIHYELFVHSVTDDKINLSLFAVEFNETMFFEVNRSISFSRTFEIPIIYNMTPSFLQQALPQFLYDLEREGYGLSALAGESLLFEITIEELYKTSQYHSYSHKTNGDNEDRSPVCTDWMWGNTTYTWSVNVTDGYSWTNKTYVFTTGGSRYDVNNDNTVNYMDALITWAYRTNNPSGFPYEGLYDVNQDGKINYIDALTVWANRGV